VIGHLSSGGEGVDLARLSPRVKRAESDWRATVTLECPRWVTGPTNESLDVSNGTCTNVWCHM
jgi:hypothetical protein